MSGFLQRLKERKLVQWALAYAAGAWLVLQVLSLVAGTYEWPPLAMRAAVGAVGVGFPVALVLAWYHGERGAQRVSGTELAILTLLLAVGGGVLWRVGPRSAAPTPDVPAKAPATAIPEKSIAVLPFVNMSGDAKNEYFSDGITEEILNALAQIPGLKVAARTSAFAFKGKGEDLRKVGETLGVAHVLEGSVQSAGDEVRITAQLIDARSGYHVWSEKYDRKLTSMFAIEDEISRAIADKLRMQWTGNQALVRDATRDPDAHALYLRALAAIAQRGDALTEAARLLEEATTRDPGYAAAWAQLSQVFELLPWYELDAWQPALENAERAARRALALDPQSAEGHAALANVLRDRFEFAEADREYQRSLELNPGNSEVHNQYGQLLDAIGQFAGAVEHEQIASLQDPLAPNPRYMLGIILDSVRLHAEATAMFSKVVGTTPGFVYSYDQIAFSRLYAGDHAAAQTAARTAAEKTGEDAQVAVALMTAAGDPAQRAQTLPLVRNVHRLGHTELDGLARAFWYAEFGATDQALDELQRWAASAAQGERFNGLRFLWMPAFDPLREDARFKAWMKPFGVPHLGAAALRDAGTKIAVSQRL